MFRFKFSILASLLILTASACDSSSETADTMTVEEEQPDTPELMYSCNETTDRAELLNAMPLECDQEPESVVLEDDGRQFEIFKYEASHPLATNLWAFPCAATSGDKFEAPDQATQACSKPGVIPWHSVRWEDADAACEQIGWRLCTRDELGRACGGADETLYTFGAEFQNGACNVRDAYRAVGEDFSSMSPAGHFAECRSSDGVFDLTGNLWEWSSERDEADGAARFYHGAGWKTIAERHRDTDQACSIEARIPGFSARSFIKEFVGFRCCRNIP